MEALEAHDYCGKSCGGDLIIEEYYENLELSKNTVSKKNLKEYSEYGRGKKKLVGKLEKLPLDCIRSSQRTSSGVHSWTTCNFSFSF